MSETHRWLGGIDLVVGAWVFVSAFAFAMVGASFWNNVVVGAAIFVLSGYSAYEASESEPGNMWTSGLSGLLGLWMIVAPFVYGSAGIALWSDVLSGIVVAVLAGYNAYEASESAGTATTQSTA